LSKVFYKFFYISSEIFDGFSSSTKPLLLLLLLSKDYYKKAFILIVAAVLILYWWIVLYLPSTLSRATNAIWDEYIWNAYIEMFFVNITKMISRNMIISYIVVFSVVLNAL